MSPLTTNHAKPDANVDLTTRGHARVTSSRQIPSVCGAFVPATIRTCPRFSPWFQDGKEGVDGSSPSEGFLERPANMGLSSSNKLTSVERRVPDGYISFSCSARNVPFRAVTPMPLRSSLQILGPDPLDTQPDLAGCPGNDLRKATGTREGCAKSVYAARVVFVDEPAEPVAPLKAGGW